MRSYTQIAEAMGCAPQAILFVSDSHPELLAAGHSGLQIVCSQRKVTDDPTPHTYPTIHDFSQICLIAST